MVGIAIQFQLELEILFAFIDYFPELRNQTE